MVEKDFNITSKEVGQRLLWTTFPFGKNVVKFNDAISLKLDLYGPFWVVTTLVIILEMIGNLSAYLNSNFVNIHNSFSLYLSQKTFLHI